MVVFTDFDTTLKFPYTKGTNQFTVTLIKTLPFSALYIITSRHESNTSKAEIEDFCLSNGLIPTDIIFTNGESKHYYINVSPSVFIDDDPVERINVATKFKSCMIFDPTEEYSKQELDWYCFGK